MGLPFTRGITMANNASVAAKSNPQLGGIVPPKNTPAIDITFHTSQHIVLTPAKYQSCCRVPSRFTRSKRVINNTNPISLIENPNNVRLPKERRSEEHTSELQSRGHLVCRLLLEKKKRDRKW